MIVRHHTPCETAAALNQLRTDVRTSGPEVRKIIKNHEAQPRLSGSYFFIACIFAGAHSNWRTRTFEFIFLDSPHKPQDDFTQDDVAFFYLVTVMMTSSLMLLAS